MKKLKIVSHEFIRDGKFVFNIGKVVSPDVDDNNLMDDVLDTYDDILIMDYPLKNCRSNSVRVSEYPHERYIIGLNLGDDIYVLYVAIKHPDRIDVPVDEYKIYRTKEEASERVKDVLKTLKNNIEPSYCDQYDFNIFEDGGEMKHKDNENYHIVIKYVKRTITEE